MRNLRWKLFKLLSRIGWWVCPEPDRTAMQRHMPRWRDINLEAPE